MVARVQDNGETSDPFQSQTAVKQGCVLAPTLFSLMFSAMLTDAYRDSDVGVDINFRIDGGVFNPRRLKARTKTTSTTQRQLLDSSTWSLCYGPALTGGLNKGRENPRREYLQRDVVSGGLDATTR